MSENCFSNMPGFSATNIFFEFEKLNLDIRTKQMMLEIFIQADKLNIKKIGIGMRDKSFTTSKEFEQQNKTDVFYKAILANTIFAEGYLDEKPIIWKLVENVDTNLPYSIFPLKEFKDSNNERTVLGGMCGNPGQMQIRSKYTVQGIYENVNGQWQKIK